MKVALREERVALRTPLRAAWGELRSRPLLRLDLVGEDGVVGRGESAPLEPYDGVSSERCREALETYAGVLREALDTTPGHELLDACRDAVDLPQALAAVDLALWDRAGRRAGKPVCALLSDAPLAAVPVNATVGADDRASAAAAAANAARAGFRCVKLKVGLGDDAGRVAAVRAALGPKPLLRLDANGAWTPDEAVRWLEVLGPAGLELVEEPTHGIAELRSVRERTAVRVALDETAAQVGALAPGVADAVCLKISSSGGIAALLARAALAQTAGMEVYVASTYDGPLGIAAALHAAAALRVRAPCGLATLEALAGIDPGPLTVRRGAIGVPRTAGLGL